MQGQQEMIELQLGVIEQQRAKIISLKARLAAIEAVFAERLWE